MRDIAHAPTTVGATGSAGNFSALISLFEGKLSTLGGGSSTLPLNNLAGLSVTRTAAGTALPALGSTGGLPLAFGQGTGSFSVLAGLLKALDQSTVSVTGGAGSGSAGGTASASSGNGSGSVSILSSATGSGLTGGLLLNGSSTAPSAQPVDITPVVADLQTIITDLQSRATNNPSVTAELSQFQSLLSSIPAGTTVTPTLPGLKGLTGTTSGTTTGVSPQLARLENILARIASNPQAMTALSNLEAKLAQPTSTVGSGSGSSSATVSGVTSTLPSIASSQ